MNAPYTNTNTNHVHLLELITLDSFPGDQVKSNKRMKGEIHYGHSVWMQLWFSHSQRSFYL